MPVPLLGFFAGTIFAKFLSVVIVATVAKILIGLGVGITAYVGLDLVFDYFRALIDARMAEAQTLMPSMVQLLDLAGFGTALNMIFSTVTGILTVKGVAGAVKKFRVL